jgi:hypothetical protein
VPGILCVQQGEAAMATEALNSITRIPKQIFIRTRKVIWAGRPLPVHLPPCTSAQEQGRDLCGCLRLSGLRMRVAGRRTGALGAWRMTA